MAGSHALLSPSKAEMWMTCAGSIAFGRDAPNVPSSYAAEGTAYHDVSSKALIAKNQCADYIGQVFTVHEDGPPPQDFKFTIDAENASFAQSYVDRVRAIPGRLFVEKKLDLSAVLGVKDQGGTGDAVVLDRTNRKLWVRDLKFGRGEIVYAAGNKQMRLYGGGALHFLDMLGIEDDWKVIMSIDQPRVGHFDTEEVSVGFLRNWLVEAAMAAQKAYAIYERNDRAEILANLVPSAKGCRWCPMAGQCPAKSREMLDAFPVSEVGQIAQKRITMSDEEVSAAWLRTDEMEKWISAIRAEALSRALGGSTLPGLKLTDGRKGARKFNNPEKAKAIMVEAIGDEAYQPREIITPTVAEKRLKKHKDAWDRLNGRVTQEDGTVIEVESIISQSDGSKTLVRVEDPRPPAPITTLEFPNVSPATEGLLS